MQCSTTQLPIVATRPPGTPSGCAISSQAMQDLSTDQSAGWHATQSLVQVVPDVVNVLEADAEADQRVGGIDRALRGVAGAALHRRLDRAEARDVDDEPGRLADRLGVVT